jgi:predicted transcriptional regulator
MSLDSLLCTAEKGNMGETDPTDRTNTTPLVEEKEISEIFQDPSPAQEAFLSVFNLQESHIRAYITVIEYPESKTDRIAEAIGRHRRYVATTLRELHTVGLVEREKRRFETGGVGHVYSPLPPEEVKSHFQTELQEWLTDAQAEISRIDRRIEVGTDPLCCDHDLENESEDQP